MQELQYHSSVKNRIQKTFLSPAKQASENEWATPKSQHVTYKI